MIQALKRDDPDDLYEVVAGQRVVKLTGAYENLLAAELYGYLRDFLRSNPTGRAAVEVMFTLPGVENERRPATAYVSFARWPRGRRVPAGAAWAVVPELAVEVISPGNTFDEVLGKVEECFRAGVTLVWVIHPRLERVHVYTGPAAVRIVSRGEELTGEPVLPGFRLPLAELFPPADDPPPV